MKFTKVKNPNNVDIVKLVGVSLLKAGFVFNLVGADKKTGFDFRNFRINPAKRGYNVGGFSYHQGYTEKPRRTRCLSWLDWVEVNTIINNVLDTHYITAKVYTLGGKFLVRDVDGRRNAKDWEHLAGESVGSMTYPVERCNLYFHESESDHARR